MVLHAIRALFLVVVLAITFSYAFQEPVQWGQTSYVTIYCVVPSLGALALILADMLWRRKRLQVLSGLFFGVLTGLVIAYAVTEVVDMIVRVFPSLPPSDDPAVQLIKGLLGVAAVFLCVSFVLQTKDDFRFIIPYVEFTRQAKGGRPLLLDTSVIIDGRIADVARSGIFETELLVPRFVLEELQAIADSADKLRRNRGRRGLDVLKQLQESEEIDLRIVESRQNAIEQVPEVDGKLMVLAGHLNARVVTNDYNLNKVAQLRGVDVINLNDLANALKPVVLPGEKMSVRVVKPGEASGQGVGYLDDGTMVVVENGRNQIGSEVQIQITSSLQTSAGRMIFGKLDSAGQ